MISKECYSDNKHPGAKEMGSFYSSDIIKRAHGSETGPSENDCDEEGSNTKKSKFSMPTYNKSKTINPSSKLFDEKHELDFEDSSKIKTLSKADSMLNTDEIDEADELHLNRHMTEVKKKTAEELKANAETEEELDMWAFAKNNQNKFENIDSFKIGMDVNMVLTKVDDSETPNEIVEGHKADLFCQQEPVHNQETNGKGVIKKKISFINKHSNTADSNDTSEINEKKALNTIPEFPDYHDNAEIEPKTCTNDITKKT